MAGKERLQVVSNFAPRRHDPSGRGQRREKHLSVAAVHNATIHQYHGPDVGPRSDEASEPLFQLERGERQQVVPKPIHALLYEGFDPGGGEWLSGDLEGKFGQDQDAKRWTWNVDTFPEAVGAEEDRVSCLSKPPQEVISLPLPLYQERPPAADTIA